MEEKGLIGEVTHRRLQHLCAEDSDNVLIKPGHILYLISCEVNFTCFYQNIFQKIAYKGQKTKKKKKERKKASNNTQ